MKSKIVFCVSLLMLVQAVATAKVIVVSPNNRPPMPQTIQAGINLAVDGDTVLVYPGVYSGPNNVNLDFQGKIITVRSNVNLNNPSLSWDIINSTIIDCGGAPYSDPCGDNGNQNRAFIFQNSESRESQVIGFTIRNGYARGKLAAEGVSGFIGDVWLHYPSVLNDHPWQTSPAFETLPPETDPCTLPPAALPGEDAIGNGYGGGIYCTNASSPTISYCVIENCTVTGAQGGKGSDGMWGQWSYYTWADFNWSPDGNTYQQLLDTATIKTSSDGQGGARGGMGSGIGYGGAIAITVSSNPLISNCRFINNSAQGGRGGNGGRGGYADGVNYDQGLEGAGGNAGWSLGGGLGGAIYAGTTCNPEFISCSFIGNVAKTGPRGDGGGRGLGNVNAPNGNRVPKGAVSPVFPDGVGIAGGAVYFDTSAGTSDNPMPTFIDCNFIGNKAYQAFTLEPLENYPTGAGYPYYLPGFAEDIAGYTGGGAAFFNGNNKDIVFNTCDFIDNMGGALYFSNGCSFSINNEYAAANGQPGRKNLFQGNADPDKQTETLVIGDVSQGQFYIGPALDTGSGGAIYIGSGANYAVVSDTVFNKNRAKVNGGAIESQSNLIITNCAFSANKADGSGEAYTGFGGAIDIYLGSSLTITATNCSFTGNQSVWGGAVSPWMATGSFTNCFFIDNKAQLGGALDLAFGTGLFTITDSVFSGNRATVGSGGGIYCLDTGLDIQNCEFFNNSANGSSASGGGIDIDGAVGEGHAIMNCLFTGNSSYYGGAINCESYVEPYILNCTFSQNTAARFGGSIFAGWGSTTTIMDCIIEKSNNHAIHEEDAGGNAIAAYCLFFDNPDGHYYDSGNGLVYYDADINIIPGGSNNKVGDPLFLTGTFGNYYLNQSSSPAMNAGSNLASNLGLSTRTTAIDDADDSGQVDIGYHFSRAVDKSRFYLTTSVVGGIGTISVSPAPLPDGSYYAGTVVTVTAHPQGNWVVKNWTGTDDDSEVATVQNVVMNSDRHATVEFKQPTILNVPSEYANIMAAMNAANDGDIIIVSAGVYYGPQIQFTKAVEVRSEHPDNPAWVAQTIIDFTGHSETGIYFPKGVNSGCVLNGFIIRNLNWVGINGDGTSGPGQNGGDGLGVDGGVIWIGPEAGPVIKNCVITGNSIRGGFGSNGANADAEHNAGRGGWGGWARGGAIYCSERSYPQFINCRILNNRVLGGFGGNGGDQAGNGGNGNYGGNWSDANTWFDYDPRDLSYEWVQGDLFVKWTEMAPNIPLGIRPAIGQLNYGYRDDYLNFHYGYVGDYRWYSGYGGGVFINKSSNVTFTNCEISGNLAQGGFSGLGGNDSTIEPLRVGPLFKYEIPAYGGGVYVAAESKVAFNGCVISNNTASNPTFDHQTVPGVGSYIPTNYDPCNHYRINEYLGHGGGVCAENTAQVTFTECNLINNAAAMGGGLYGAKAELRASDCDFVSNRAYKGGGMFSQNGSASINRSQFTNNTAPHEPNDPNVMGEGGGLYFLSAQTDIANTSITGNSSEAMGGGAYFSGAGFASMLNCLLVGNSTGQMGGAIAATTFAELKIANCTIANNAVAVGGVGTGFGGGLYCSNNSYADIIDSIIWGNFGSKGAQLAVGTTSLESSSAAEVRYSDIGPLRDLNNVTAIEPAQALGIAVTSDANILVDTILGQGIEVVGQPRYTGAAIASGTFAGGLAAGIGIESGIILTTGDANLALPPNNNDGATFTDGNAPGDADLNALLQARGSAGGTTNDAAILEFTFNTSGGNLFFNFVFASEEYNEFTNSSFNDVFGFFLDGVNIALIPGTTTPVAINNVNGGRPLGTDASNPNLFHNNDPTDGGPFYAIQYDGFTTVFTAQALNVGSGNHTIKLAIADTADLALDSAVFIEAGSFSDKPSSSEPIYVGEGSTLIGWNPNVSDANKWDPNFAAYGNKNTDPLFVSGFFLSQIDAGQLINSPCWNAGSANVNSPDINLGGYTTRTDSVPDAGIVDMGYHYPPFVPVQYRLDFNAIEINGLRPTIIEPTSNLFNSYTRVQLEVNSPPDGYQVQWTGTSNDDINGVNNSVIMSENKTVTVAFVRNTCILTVLWNNGGTVTPTGGTYIRNTNVNLTATPDAGYRIESWEGTNDNNSFARTNVVTMNGDKTVRVTFSLPQTRTVPGDFTTIQEAVEAARSGDIVIVASGVYRGNTIILNREITLASTNPDDPCVVAATIIDSSGYASPAITFGGSATENTVLDGFTITSGTYNPIDRVQPVAPNKNGLDGYSIAGGAMYINTGSSPTIRNCVIRDTAIRGGHATNGLAADGTSAAGRGGWAGGSYGGGVFINTGANPTFIGCTVTNCSAIGGNAGNGGGSSGTYGGVDFRDANYGGSWSDANSFPVESLLNSDGQPYNFDYPFYSGVGGGVFCNTNSRATFIGCNITNNTASGGMSGIGGDRPWVRPEPVTAYRIPSYGGGVFCAGSASIRFIGCNITGNVAPKPDATYHVNPYLGHGGGIAFAGIEDIQLENCNISGNTSAVGGGIYWMGGSPVVLDCNILNNTAYVGGGLYGTQSSGQIKGCTLRNNFAGVSPNDVDVIAGQGGGIFGSSINADITDCLLVNNISTTSGGGIHIYGPGYSDTIIRNCLLTGNLAGRDGGGISTNWGAVVSVENCTLYNNEATGTFGNIGNTGFGGGLYCSYSASTDIKNSIFWDNNGLFGKEIAEATGFEGTQLCGTVSILYSDIRGGQAGVYISPNCPNNLGIGNINVDPRFVTAAGNDFHLQNITAGQAFNSPCIDAGGESAVSAGMFNYSTSTLGAPDMGVVDIGYHYSMTDDYCKRWDLSMDNFVNFEDLAIFAKSWVGMLGSSGSSSYNGDDLYSFTTCWLIEVPPDADSPTPNPMTWAITPHALAGNSVGMTATTAVDASGEVYYQFADVNGVVSAWQANPYYVATGLNPTGEYCFRVRARDKYNNITAWSEPACVTDIGDIIAPTPPPIFIAVAAQNINRIDPNNASGQYEWDGPAQQWDWWHRIIVDVTNVADNTTPTGELRVSFICTDPDNGNVLKYSSDNVIPAALLPIRIGFPVAVGGRFIEQGYPVYGSYRLTWNGANQIVYEVYVESSGGSYGKQLEWQVCVSDASGNSACSGTHLIPQ